MSKIKITVLKVADPDEFLDEYPVEKLDWMVKCPYYTDCTVILTIPIL